jgi:hypothetical protein
MDIIAVEVDVGGSNDDEGGDGGTTAGGGGDEFHGVPANPHGRVEILRRASYQLPTYIID